MCFCSFVADLNCWIIFSACHQSLQGHGNQVSIRFRCFESGKNLKSAGHQPLRADFGHHWAVVLFMYIKGYWFCCCPFIIFCIDPPPCPPATRELWDSVYRAYSAQHVFYSHIFPPTVITVCSSTVLFYCFFFKPIHLTDIINE